MTYVHWNTPDEILYLVRDMCGPITLDPCSNHGSRVLAEEEWHFPFQNGLLQAWDSPVVFVNPPYSRDDNAAWAQKWFHEACRPRRHMFGLVQAAPGTAWFRLYMLACDAVCFPDSRIAFLKDGKPVKGANFGNALFYSGPDRDRFAHHFTPLGSILYR